MAKSFTRTIVAEAKSLGLSDIEICNRKHTHKILIGFLPSGTKIKVAFDPFCSDPRAPKNVVADLRRKARWSVEHAAGSLTTEHMESFSANQAV